MGTEGLPDLERLRRGPHEYRRHSWWPERLRSVTALLIFADTNEGVQHVMDIERVEFESLVGDALDQIPRRLMDLIDNLVILVEDEPPRGEATLLGIYEGIPLTERGSVSYAGFLPDRITIYRLPILQICMNRHDVVREVKVTVVHEIAHYFGIDDHRLHELGWG